ncbi:ABC transporter ATP-binding protein/permease [Methylocystis heyeri]|uniref:ABC transporter ATP-binding protein/permease n=1 Tax=Methylocystis heyeri TaxID=391905 RepID=A0A6B8KL66_9HYPH|nr:ABC transporter ATP-binding protein/permease [Methylocystis heyeri]QGM47478.1 ABC transporter ATP-binding protein/permease [Methylocystis heyeri]
MTRRKLSLAQETRVMLRLLRMSPQRSILFWLCIALLVVISATAYGQIRLNAWNKPFYDALSNRDFLGFVGQLQVFVVLGGVLLALNVAQTWFNQMLRMRLREALTRDLFDQWLAPRRAFMIAGAGEIGVNPDQRIHEDVRHLSDLTTDLGVGLLQATLLLFSFIGVLWALSSGVVFLISGESYVVPGYMVWCALFYAGAASLASWKVGRPLIPLNAEHYARESDLRFALVHVNEHAEGIAAYRGEKEEKTRLDHELDRVLEILRRLVSAITNLTWVTAGYGWFTIVAPIIVAAPAYFSGGLTLGGLLMSAGAFTQVQQSLRWFVDNAGAIADWSATLHRVIGFRQALLQMDSVGEETSRIEICEKGDRLVLDRLRILSPAGCSVLDQDRIEIAPGEHVLAVGPPASGKTCLFRALAGLWPWGEGAVITPVGGVMFMPKRPFIPDGPLRDVLAYPLRAEDFAEEDYVFALTRLGFAYLSKVLDRRARWDRELTEREQQGVAFARLLLHKPHCVVIDGAVGALAADLRKTLFQIFSKELKSAALLCIDGPQAEPDCFDRVVHLNLDREGECLKEEAA